MDKDFREIVKQAADAVIDVDETFKVTAFQEVLRHLLSEADEKIGKDIKQEKREEGGLLEIIASSTSIPVDLLRSIFKTGKTGKLEVEVSAGGETRADSQKNVSYVYLLGAIVGLGKDWVTSVELGRELSRHGVIDGNVSFTLGRERGFIASTGKGRSKKYRLTPQGVKKATEILRREIHVE